MFKLIYQHTEEAHILHTHPSRHVACDISPPSFGSLTIVQAYVLNSINRLLTNNTLSKSYIVVRKYSILTHDYICNSHTPVLTHDYICN